MSYNKKLKMITTLFSGQYTIDLHPQKMKDDIIQYSDAGTFLNLILIHYFNHVYIKIF